MTRPTDDQLAALLRELAHFCCDPLFLTNLGLAERALAAADQLENNNEPS
jgi:hypothetical protein